MQSDRSNPIKFFELYNKFKNYKNNFLKLDKSPIGSFKSIDNVYKCYENNSLY